MDKGNILDLIRHNVRKNEDITNYPVEVKELDFKSVVIHSGVLSVLSKVQVILAADGKSIKPPNNQVIINTYICSDIRQRFNGIVCKNNGKAIVSKFQACDLYRFGKTLCLHDG